MSKYISRSYLQSFGLLSAYSLRQFERQYPGRLDAMIEAVCNTVDALLSQKYATPFKEPVPEVLKLQVAALVSFQVMLSRGFRGTVQEDRIVQAKDDAWDYFREAAAA